MTAAAIAQSSYRRSSKSTATPRAIECQLLTELTGDLASADKNKAANRPRYIQALSRNLEFWTMLAIDISREGNKLPSELKSQLFYLFEYTRLHTRKILGGDTQLTTDPLVEINRNILSGLSRGVQKE